MAPRWGFEGFLPRKGRERRERLTRLQRAIESRTSNVVQAIQADYGARSSHEILLSEVHLTLSHLKYTRRHLRRWMRRERRPVSWPFFPGKGWIHYQPLGDVPVTYSRWLYRIVYPIWDAGPVKIAGTLSEGDRIAGFDVVHFPGHAPGQIGLWREGDRLCLCSDTVYLKDVLCQINTYSTKLHNGLLLPDNWKYSIPIWHLDAVRGRRSPSHCFWPFADPPEPPPGGFLLSATGRPLSTQNGHSQVLLWSGGIKVC